MKYDEILFSYFTAERLREDELEPLISKHIDPHGNLKYEGKIKTNISLFFQNFKKYITFL